MIGNNIRGIRHLFRVADTSLRDALIYFREGVGYQFCKVIKTKADSIIGEKLLIFNNAYNAGGNSVGSILASRIFTHDESVIISTRYSKLIEVTAGDSRMYDFPYLSEIILLPPTFSEDYISFLSSNAKMIRTLTSKYGYSAEDEISKRIYMYTDGSKNFYMWAINTFFQNNTSLASIKRVMSWNDLYGQLAKKLSKNTITAYTSGRDMLTLSEELSLLRRDKRVNDVINSFNTAQKKLLKGVELTEKDKNTFAKFYRLSEAKKSNFIRKMSTIEDFNELMRQMRHITSTHFDWNKDSFMDFLSNVEGINYEIMVNEGDIVLLKVTDYETIKQLAKTTNWCISKNKSYWNQYVEHRPESTQYMVFDFSKKEDDLLSIIGFTTMYNRGITNAHDFSNNDMMKQDSREERVFLNSFVSQYKSGNGIYNVLNNCGIDITLVAHYDKPLFEWNKEAMYTYLYECVKKDNVDILCDKENMVAISVVDSNIRYFIGDTYIETINESSWGLQHIIFMDFSMSPYDPNRLQYAIIAGSDEAYCMSMLNEHSQSPNTDFNTRLAQFGLPYDIIRRPDDPYDKIKNAFLSFNVPLLNESISNNDMLYETIYDYIGEDTATDYISSSITDNMSFDYLNLFYSRNIKLHNLIGCGHTSTIIKNVFNNLISYGRNLRGVDGVMYKKPTEEDINAFYDKTIGNFEKTMYVGCYLAIIMIIEHEGKDADTNSLYKRISSTICMFHKEGEVFDSIMEKIAQVINFNVRGDACSSWVIYAYNSGGERIKTLLYELASKYDNVKASLKSVEDRNSKRWETVTITTTMNNNFVVDSPLMDAVGAGRNEADDYLVDNG